MDKNIPETTAEKKILVHICCAACASYIFSELKKENYKVFALFYNPEVHGLSEYKRRLTDVQCLCKERDIKLIVPEYNVSDFFSLLLPFQDKNSIKFISDKDRYKRRRCQTCVWLLLGTLARTANEMKVSSITTTMLCSPFRNHNEIWDRGMDISVEKSLQFYYKDFRKGYWNGRNYARTHSMNIPRYCGCSESLEKGLLE